MSPPVSEFYDDDDRLIAAGEAILMHKVFDESNVKRNPGGRFSKSTGGKFVQGLIDFENFKIGDLSSLKIGNLATIKRSDGSKLIDSGWGFLKKYNGAVKKIAALDRSFSAKGQAWLKDFGKKAFPGPRKPFSETYPGYKTYQQFRDRDNEINRSRRYNNNR